MVCSELLDETQNASLTLVSGVSVRDLPIGPTEAFVLSRIDGQTSQDDLSTATGLSAEELAQIVDRLIALGAVRAADRSSLTPSTQSATARSGAHAISRAPAPDAAVRSVELSAEQQRVLLDLDQRVDSLDHYQLLGVAPDADAKLVRAAYYGLVHIYHPDRFFGRRLGSFQAPLLRVFGKFTEAYEVLRRAESRAEYDRYLAARQRTLAFEREFFDAAQQSQEVARALERIQDAASGTGSATVSSLPPPSRAPESVPASGPVLRPSSAQPLDPEARRKALARKLGHSSVPPARPSSSSFPAPSVAAAAELKRRYEQRMQRARDEQREHYIALSNEAVARNDLLAATNALRVACSLSPDNLELAGDLLELERRAATGMWEAYLERAKYAAAEGRFAEAAECYERAALGQSSAVLCERAAFYTLEAGGDLRRASQLAKQAVSMAPNSAKCRLTLAQVYAAANLKDSALAELERARALQPDQPIIKEWIARVKRGDA